MSKPSQRLETARSASPKLVVAAILCALSAVAHAHTGMGTQGLVAGLEHPLGADHLLAMVAVGVWSVFALSSRRAWLGPAVFMASLVVGAGLGARGLRLPHLEHAISASVVIFGLMLIGATRRMPVALGLSLIAVAASLHGLAHGAELPLSAEFSSYAAGFLVTTAFLHVGGVFAGLAMRVRYDRHVNRLLGALGLAVSGAGVVLLSQL